MKDLIEFIVKALVDDPSEVNITEITGDKITLYEPVSYTHLTLPTIYSV